MIQVRKITKMMLRDRTYLFSLQAPTHKDNSISIEAKK